MSMNGWLIIANQKFQLVLISYCCAILQENYMEKHRQIDEERRPDAPSHKQKTISSSNSQIPEVVEGNKTRSIEGGSVPADPTSRGMPRGKYRQYEDNQTILEKIRYFRTQRYPDCEIMKKLDNMPRRTYYNYVKKLQEQDKELMMQWMAENVEQVSEELIVNRETYCQVLRELQEIIEDRNTPPKTKMEAIDQKLAISGKLANFVNSGMSNTIKTERLSALGGF